VNTRKTCRNDHEFTEENTILMTNGRRRCRACKNSNDVKSVRTKRIKAAAGADLRAQFIEATSRVEVRPLLIRFEDWAPEGSPRAETKGLPKGMSLGACPTCGEDWEGEAIQFERTDGSGLAWCAHCAINAGTWRVYRDFEWGGKRLDDGFIREAEANCYLKTRKRTFENPYRGYIGDAAEVPEDRDDSISAPMRRTRTVPNTTRWSSMGGGTWA
jgi:hypothetical protein